MFEGVLTDLAQKLPTGVPTDEGDPEFELMSGSFIWRDELPFTGNMGEREVGALRALLRYRTSLLTGIPDDRFQEVWNQLRSSAAGWVGFAEERCCYSQKLAERYLQLKPQRRPKNTGKQP